MILDKISLIVPIYNVEAYLDKCINSILNQSYCNLEIILVDDGSPDNCPEICDRFAENDKRVIVLHKQNGGLSDARNAGIEIATGKYICFVDSDDWLHEDYCKALYHCMKDYDADIVECGITMVYPDKDNIEIIDASNRVYGVEEALSSLIEPKGFKSQVWNKLYKSELVRKFIFQKGVINEDEFWTYKVFANAETIAYCNKALYYYLQRESSIMGSYSLKRLDGLKGMFGRHIYISGKYPRLSFVSKIALYKACLYNYQQVLIYLDNQQIVYAHDFIYDIFKVINFELDELKKMKLKEICWYVFACISLKIVCRVRNTLSIGL